MRANPSWYLDPLVAEQKRRIFREWILGSVGPRRPAVVLKTDLFEEAHNRDRILYDLFPAARLVIGIDLDLQTTRLAARRPDGEVVCLAADVLRLPLGPESVDLIVSTSTLDHFDDPEDLDAAIAELARVLRPGGSLMLVLDNPGNPLYHLLRWASRRGWLPFALGHTLSGPAMTLKLEEAGFEVSGIEPLIHNPRLVSTLLFLALRRTLGPYANRPIGALLRLFAIVGRLPSRKVTACFLAACASKPVRKSGVILSGEVR